MAGSPRQQWPDRFAKPLSRIPERRSSRNMRQQRQQSLLAPTVSATPPRPGPGSVSGSTVPAMGGSFSPIRRPGFPHLRRAPSRTFVPSVLPVDILDAPTLTHPRINLAVRLSSSVFVGGATVEGEVYIAIDGGTTCKRRKSQQTIAFRRISVTLAGIERCKSRQEIFRALTTDLIDDAHPPPTSMAPEPAMDSTWDVVPSDSMLPFRLNLPVVMGPPPYKAKKVGITYLLSTLVEARIGGKSQFVRHSREIIVLTVHDPEKALVNLPNPLLVSDDMQLAKKSIAHKITLTAGLHRQTWISGYLVFVDMRIDNQTSKTVKHVELQLEKTTLFHNYPAPSTGARSADVLRLPDYRHSEIIARKEITSGSQGAWAQPQEFRTCQMELPIGLVSIETGRFFGIRFFLNIQITCSFNKHLKVQLPITIIHPNSIDIPPNALAQVTASIEHKHRNLSSASGTGSPYRYRPGQAFTTARRRSYLQLGRDTMGSSDMEDLTRALEASPRKMSRQSNDASPKKMKITRRQSASVLGEIGNRSSHHQRLAPRSSFDRTRASQYKIQRSSFDSSLRLADEWPSYDSARESRVQRSSLEAKVLKGLRPSFEMGPRLQRSTSGLAFDDSDKENLAPGKETTGTYAYLGV